MTGRFSDILMEEEKGAQDSGPMNSAPVNGLHLFTVSALTYTQMLGESELGVLHLPEPDAILQDPVLITATDLPLWCLLSFIALLLALPSWNTGLSRQSRQRKRTVVDQRRKQSLCFE